MSTINTDLMSIIKALKDIKHNLQQVKTNPTTHNDMFLGASEKVISDIQTTIKNSKLLDSLRDGFNDLFNSDPDFSQMYKENEFEQWLDDHTN